MKPLIIESVFRICIFINEFSYWCCSSPSGEAMLVHKMKMGLLAINKERKRGEGCDTQMESQNRFTELEGEERVGRCAPLGDKGVG